MGQAIEEMSFFLRTKCGTCFATSVGLCEMLTDVLSGKKGERELIKETSSEQIIHPNFHIPKEEG